jgi:hypothetical protein
VEIEHLADAREDPRLHRTGREVLGEAQPTGGAAIDAGDDCHRWAFPA